MAKYTQTVDDNGVTHYWNRAGREVDKGGRWIKGTCGNPAGKPKGARNKLTLVKEAAERGEGLSPGEMLMEIARRNFSQNTTGGDNTAIKAIIEANKYIESTKDAEIGSDILKDMTDDEINEELTRIMTEVRDPKKRE